MIERYRFSSTRSGPSRSGVTRAAAFAAVALALCAFGPAPARATIVDAFDDVKPWSANPADGVDLAIVPDAGAMRLDFNFKTGGGYAVAHRALSVDLPENYAFTFRVRGRCRPNSLEFKLIDSTGENVWWNVHRDMTFSEGWTTITIKKRQIQWAWGPKGGGDITHVAALEYAVTAGQGGQGSVWLDDLEMKPLPPPGAAPPTPVASASSARAGHAAALAVDGDSLATGWAPAATDKRPVLTLDLGVPREFGGLTLRWSPSGGTRDYMVEASDDGAAWRPLHAVTGGHRVRDDFYLPEFEARYLRVVITRLAATATPTLFDLAIRPLEWGATPDAFFQNIAKESAPGAYPRGLSGQQVFWTTVGVPNDSQEVLFSEDGAIELGQKAGSLEPFLWEDGRLYSWHDAKIGQSLELSPAPIPSVQWEIGTLSLSVQATAFGPAGASSAAVVYEVANRTATARDVTLLLAIRPFQVDPPTQFLNWKGGFAPIHEIERAGVEVLVNGKRRIFCQNPGFRFGAAAFDRDDLVDLLRAGGLPGESKTADSTGFASGALRYDLHLAARAKGTITLILPLYDGSLDATRRLPSIDSNNLRALHSGSDEPGPQDQMPIIRLSGAHRDVIDAVDAQLAWAKISAAGPALQPGTRSYARSWIRDGALTSSALLRLGQAGMVKDFIDWYAPHQFDNGKIPCVVDQRGSDPVPEHDSSGEFIFLIAEYDRYTSDHSLAEKYYPRVVRAAAYLDSLRHERRTADYQKPDTKQFYGLLPPSISHEGYSAKPMHSYWDDLWALRGFKDAEFLAGLLGHREDRARFGRMRAEFGADLSASMTAAMAAHSIDFIPGCADLGDFDATSTTMALSPVQAQNVVPAAALNRTFDKYWEFFEKRAGGEPWDAFTPYEVRNIGAFVRLGWRDRAAELAGWFLKYQKPVGWKQWPEVVFRNEREPHFIGDLPHTWVGTDYIRSVLDMLAYDRESDSTLVLAAGVPAQWLGPGGGVSVKQLRTPWGWLSYELRSAGNETVLTIPASTNIPPGGFILQPPVSVSATVSSNGVPMTRNAAGEIVLRKLPAEVRFTAR